MYVCVCVRACVCVCLCVRARMYVSNGYAVCVGFLWMASEKEGKKAPLRLTIFPTVYTLHGTERKNVSAKEWAAGE